MKHKVVGVVIFLAVIALFPGLMVADGVIPADAELTGQDGLKNRVQADFRTGRIPLYFIQNQGQYNQAARFYARASRYTLWLTGEGLVFDSSRPLPEEARQDRSQNGRLQRRMPGEAKAHSGQYAREVTRLVFLDADPEPAMVAADVAELKVNYFKGNDPGKWHCDVPTSRAVTYRNLYAGIDLKVYGMEKEVEYDWVVKPQADPSRIRFAYRNVKGTRIDGEGNLVIETEFGQMIHKQPVSYQEKPQAMNNGSSISNRSPVEVRFQRCGENTYGFAVGAYDKERELVIDPLVLLYSTYLGGAAIDYANDIAVDDSGHAYVAGYTISADFPTLNPYRGSIGGSYDAFVARIDTQASGASSLVYCTYLGGTTYDQVKKIAVDGSGHVYVAGWTDSTDFPTVNAYMGDGGGYDAFVARINTNASGAAGLIYSTYLGGSGGDYAHGIAVDGGGHAYVAGETYSTNFPTVNAYMGDDGGCDAFVARIDTNASGAAGLVYSTYLGGAASGDFADEIAVDGSGHAYVTGSTASTDFPTLNPYMGYAGAYDAFITRINTNASGAAGLIYSTYLGGAYNDVLNGIAVDGSGHAYVCGYTESTDFPTVNAYMGDDGERDAFIARIDTNAGAAAGLVYSTYLGGSGADYARGIAVDGSGHAYVTGYTQSTDFPTLNQYMGYAGNADAFVARVDTNESGAAGLVYSTYLGGADNEVSQGIAVDGSGHVYVSGWTSSTDFPTVNPFMTDPGDVSYDAFITKLVLPGIGVTAPNGGEEWPVGSACNITWSSTGSIEFVKIEYSTDNGSAWSEITESTLNDGSYAWTVPASPSTQCLVRISDAADGDPVDVSDATFTITVVGSLLVISSPNGGEGWTLGDFHNIAWTAYGVSNTLKLTLLKDGAPVGVIASGVDASAGSYAWTVGEYIGGMAETGSGYTVKIKEQETTAADESDATFKISAVSGDTFVYDGIWEDGATAGVEGWHPGDYDGDGFLDLLNVLVKYNKVFVSDGTQFINLGRWLQSDSGLYGWFPGDFNGDGKTDLMRFTPANDWGPDRTQVFLSTGSAFLKDYIWSYAVPGVDGYTVGDFNGDGKDDMLIYDTASLESRVYVSSGSEFLSPSVWFTGHNGMDGWYCGDFNGDGRTDLARTHFENGTVVLLSTGTAFAFAGVWTPALPQAGGWLVADYNGDGMDDLLRGKDDVAGTEVFLSTGAAFQYDGVWSDAPAVSAAWRVGDFSGDTRADLLFYQVSPDRQTEVYLSTPAGSSSGALKATRDANHLNDGIDLSRPVLPQGVEDELIQPWLEKWRNNEEGNFFYRIKREYEEKLGRKVRDNVIYRMLERYRKENR